MPGNRRRDCGQGRILGPKNKCRKVCNIPGEEWNETRRKCYKTNEVRRQNYLNRERRATQRTPSYLRLIPKQGNVVKLSSKDQRVLVRARVILQSMLQ